MATDIRDVPGTMSNDADFRAWVAGWEAALLAGGGMIHTPGITGELDPATVNRPAVGVDAGFRIYQFNDSFQATEPIYLRVTFGIHSNNVTQRRMKAQIGTGINAATGAITGRLLVEQTSQLVNAGTSMRIYSSGGAGRATILSGDPNPLGSSPSPICISVERLRKIDGSPTDVATLFWLTTSTSQMVVAMIMAARLGQAGYTTAPSLGAAAPRQDQAMPLIGDDAMVAPLLYPFAPDWLVHPGIAIAHGGTALWAPPGTIQLQHMGALRTFMPIGNAYLSSTQLGPGTTFGAQGLLLWE